MKLDSFACDLLLSDFLFHLLTHPANIFPILSSGLRCVSPAESDKPRPKVIVG